MSHTRWNSRFGRYLMALGLATLAWSLPLALAACEGDETTTTTSAAPVTSTTTTAAATPFSDVPAGHAYYTQIAELAARDIVTGFADGRFRPDTRVTRQQFAKMIVLTASYPVSENDICTFGDVQNSGSGSLYPDNYIAVCAARGITTGKTPTEFAPQDYLTRAQLITMVARDAGLPEPPAGYTPPFRDFSVAHYPWARKAHHSGLLNGLLEFEPGHKGVYDFWANATRGEACVLLYNLLQGE